MSSGRPIADDLVTNEIRSAYIHVPFCRHRCGYCNFSVVAGRAQLVPQYLQALKLELESNLQQPRPVDTLYLGGGTPSMLTPGELRRLLQLVSYWLPTAPEGEFTCELNPVDCDHDRLSELAAAGVNRVSLGGQSFSARKLRVLERDHSPTELLSALKHCHQHIDNVSLDLIFAVPGESLVEWQTDLSQARNTPISHLSSYGLTIEKGSAFYGRTLRKQLLQVDADAQLELYEYAIDELSTEGWEHYEVSSFARDGRRSRHNQNYWCGRPWWAFGPGAASLLPWPIETSPDPFDPNQSRTGKPAQPEREPIASATNTNLDERYLYTRNVNHRSPTTYIRKVLNGDSPVAEQDPITLEQHIRERLVFGLRQMQGVNLFQLTHAWGSDVRPLFEPHLSEYLRQSWLELDDQQQLRLTRAGLVISDSLWPNLL